VILVVSQPATPGLPLLPGTVAEAKVVDDHFTGATHHLTGEDATVDIVLDAISQHAWVHLACHGFQDPEDPTKSAFALHDGRLELARLMSRSLTNAELAVLSACQTATGDARLPEETVHLAAGMLAAGFRSVVGTMWSISDEDAPVIADALYANLKRMRENDDRRGLRTAYALHYAVRSLQEKVGRNALGRWVPFVHFGL
jgi:CHAT domain-containing protein